MSIEDPLPVFAVPSEPRHELGIVVASLDIGVRIDIAGLDRAAVELVVQRHHEIVGGDLGALGIVVSRVIVCGEDLRAGSGVRREAVRQMADRELDHFAPVELVAHAVGAVDPAVVLDIARAGRTHVGAEAAADLAPGAADVVRDIDADLFVQSLRGEVDDLVRIHIQIDVALIAAELVVVDICIAGEVQSGRGAHAHGAALRGRVGLDGGALDIGDARRHVERRPVFGGIGAVDRAGERGRAGGLVDRAAVAGCGRVAAEDPAGDRDRARAGIADRAAVAGRGRVARDRPAGDRNVTAGGKEHAAAVSGRIAADRPGGDRDRAAFHIERAAVCRGAAGDAAGGVHRAAGHEYRAAARRGAAGDAAGDIGRAAGQIQRAALVRRVGADVAGDIGRAAGQIQRAAARGGVFGHGTAAQREGTADRENRASVDGAVSGQSTVDRHGAVGHAHGAAVDAAGILERSIPRHGQLSRRFGVEDHGVVCGDPGAVQCDGIQRENAVIREHAVGESGASGDDRRAPAAALIFSLCGGKGDGIAVGNGQLVGDGHEVIAEQKLNRRRHAGVPHILQRRIQGIEFYGVDLADVLRQIIQPQHRFLRYVVERVARSFSILPDAVLRVIPDRRDVGSSLIVADIQGCVVVDIVLVRGQGVADGRLERAREVLVDTLLAGRDARVAHASDRRRPLLGLAAAGHGLDRQADPRMDEPDGIVVIHRVDGAAQLASVLIGHIVDRDGGGIIRVGTGLRHRQLRADGDLQGAGIGRSPGVGQGEDGLAVAVKAHQTADARAGKIDLRFVIIAGIGGRIHQIRGHLYDVDVENTQDREDAGPEAHLIVALVVLTLGDDGIIPDFIARFTPQGEKQNRFRLRGAGIQGIGEGVDLVALRHGTGDPAAVVELPACDDRRQIGIRRIGEALDLIVRLDDKLRREYGQPAVFLGRFIVLHIVHAVVALACFAAERKGIAADILAGGTGQGEAEDRLLPMLVGIGEDPVVFRDRAHVLVLQTVDRHGPIRVIIAEDLLGALHLYVHPRLRDGKEVVLIADVVVALDRFAADCDGIRTHVLAGTAIQAVLDHARNVVRRKAGHGGRQLGVLLAVDLGESVRLYVGARPGDRERTDDVAHIVVALNSFAAHRDGV